MALEKFCFCCKLENGAFIYGILSIILDAIVLIAIISTNVFVETGARSIYYDENRYNEIVYETYKTPYFWITLSGAIVYLISSILLVLGTVKVYFFF